MQREVPETIYYDCPDCDDETIHDVLRGRMGKASLECTLKCTECGRTFATTIPLPKIIKMQVVISDGPVSERTVTEIEEDDIIAVEDEFFLEDGRRLRVCSIELPGDKRVKKSKASKVKMLWCQQFDNLTIKVTINNDRVSYSRRIPALPDDEFVIGNRLELEDMDCFIHAIKTREKLIQHGQAEARDIIRIYGKYGQKSYPVLDFEDDVEDF
ncbi:MAG: hypothetical protein J6R75_04525 [Candidatus Methanomethylophilaceae archaeon]|jgi:uncharacterized Zn finger protein|nr:hypothetical protein [Candidatus Methanomethylophilaceae archaeon]